MIYKIKSDKNVRQSIQDMSRYDVGSGSISDFSRMVDHLVLYTGSSARQLCRDVKNDNPEFDRGFIRGVMSVVEFLQESSKRTHER